MSKRINIEFEKEELLTILHEISRENNPALYEKLNSTYQFILHQEKAVSLIEEEYQNCLVSCELSNFNLSEGFLYYKIFYHTINQETYQPEIENTSKIIKITNDKDGFSYKMLP